MQGNPVPYHNCTKPFYSVESLCFFLIGIIKNKRLVVYSYLQSAQHYLILSHAINCYGHHTTSIRIQQGSPPKLRSNRPDRESPRVMTTTTLTPHKCTPETTINSRFVVVVQQQRELPTSQRAGRPVSVPRTDSAGYDRVGKVIY